MEAGLLQGGWGLVMNGQTSVGLRPPLASYSTARRQPTARHLGSEFGKNTSLKSIPVADSFADDFQLFRYCKDDRPFFAAT